MIARVVTSDTGKALSQWTGYRKALKDQRSWDSNLTGWAILTLRRSRGTARRGRRR